MKAFARGYLRVLQAAGMQKQAALTLLSGPVGAGKSTMAQQLQDQYDLVLGTDIGTPQGGAYVMPPREQRAAIRAAKAQQALAAHEAGQSVLVEGYPGGLLKYPTLVDAAERLVYLDVPAEVRRQRIQQRSLARGTDPEADQAQFLVEEARLAPGRQALMEALAQKVVEMRPYVAEGLG